MTITTEQRIADLDWLLERVTGTSASAIGDSIAALIRSGELEPGTQLPTIREFARGTKTSVGTILSAWNSLRGDGLIVTHRRGGTTVAKALPAAGTPRETDPREFYGLDMAQNAPDITLQPNLRNALLAALDAKNLNVFGRDQMTEDLLAAVEPSWPFSPQAWATAGGGTEALLLAIAAAAPPGSTVALDEPVGPGVLDTLRDLGLQAVGVASDDDGPTPDSLRSALAHKPAAFVFQPGAPYAVSHRVTSSRVEELAQVLAEHDERVWVVEDDSIGPLAAFEPASIGTHLPDQVIRIRSYCKAFGIDVRTSVLGGTKQLVDRSVEMRSHGVGSNSRILQNALAYLIHSDDAADSVTIARERYASRRRRLLAAVGELGVNVKSGPESLIAWVEVSDETESLIALARQGISVGQGSKSFVRPPEPALLRLSVTLVPDDDASLDRLARTIAAAARGSYREYFD